MNLNKVLLYGNLTRDPELKALPSGGSVVSFGIATSRTFKDKNGDKKEETEFHNLVAFGKLADIIGQYLKKGRPVYVEGRLQTRSWEADGQKKYRTEIVVDSFQFGADSGASASQRQAAPKNKAAESAVEPDINPEDIPF